MNAAKSAREITDQSEDKAEWEVHVIFSLSCLSFLEGDRSTFSGNRKDVTKVEARTVQDPSI